MELHQQLTQCNYLCRSALEIIARWIKPLAIENTALQNSKYFLPSVIHPLSTEINRNNVNRVLGFLLGHWNKQQRHSLWMYLLKSKLSVLSGERWFRLETVLVLLLSPKLLLLTTFCCFSWQIYFSSFCLGNVGACSCYRNFSFTMETYKFSDSCFHQV